MLISDLDLPVSGQEEDAADNLTAIAMLAFAGDDTDLLLSNAMIGWFMSAEEKANSLVFHDEHDLNLQRGYKMLCLMAGSDPAAFSDLALGLGLPEERMDACPFEYDQAVKSWKALTGPHLRSKTDRKRRITVSYSPAAGDLKPLELFLRESGLMEMAAAQLDSLHALPAPVSFKASGCSTQNAFWNAGARDLVVCYELMAGFAEIYLNSLAPNNL